MEACRRHLLGVAQVMEPSGCRKLVREVGITTQHFGPPTHHADVRPPRLHAREVLTREVDRLSERHRSHVATVATLTRPSTCRRLGPIGSTYSPTVPRRPLAFTREQGRR